MAAKIGIVTRVAIGRYVDDPRVIRVNGTEARAVLLALVELAARAAQEVDAIDAVGVVFEVAVDLSVA